MLVNLSRIPINNNSGVFQTSPAVPAFCLHMPNLKIFSFHCRSEQYIVSFIFLLQIIRDFESGYGPLKANSRLRLPRKTRLVPVLISSIRHFQSRHDRLGPLKSLSVA